MTHSQVHHNESLYKIGAKCKRGEGKKIIFCVAHLLGKTDSNREKKLQNFDVQGSESSSLDVGLPCFVV